MIIDVGATSVASGYLDKAIACASEMVQRKLYAEAQDRYALVLVGTRQSKNDLSYPHISVINSSEGILSKANFGTLKYIEKGLKQAAGPDVLNGDWMDAVVVAMDLIHNLTDGLKVRNKRIIVLTDLGCTAGDDNIEMVIDAIKRDQIEFTFLLPQWNEEKGSGNDSYDAVDETSVSSNGNKTERGEASKNSNIEAPPHESRNETKPKTATQEAGINLMESLFSASPDAESCEIELAQELLFNKERKKKTSMAWKVDLEIGTDIQIPVAGYVAIRRENPKSWKRCLAKQDSSMKMQGFDELKPETTFVRNNEDQEVVEPENLIDAFKYGTKICPMSEVEKSAAKYEGGPKSLLLIGFVKRAEVPVSLLLGDGCMMFQPLMESEYSKMALSSLVEAMVREEMVAIVRRVYQKNSAPRLAALIPEDSTSAEGDEKRSLVYIELPFSEDLRNYQFSPLWGSCVDGNVPAGKGDPSEAQLASVDKLIDSMMLKSEENDEDGNNFRTDTLLNPYFQHLYKCLTSRAINPTKGRSLPNVDPRIKEILETPNMLYGEVSNSINKIAELFKLETIVQKKEKQTGDKAFKNYKHDNAKPESSSLDNNGDFSKRMKLDGSIDLSLNNDSLRNVTEVGSTTPVQDFEKLLQAGFHISTISIQMEKVILNLIKASFGSHGNEKVMSCLQCYRQACIDIKSPTVYNKFIRDLKDDILHGSNKSEGIWQKIVLKNIGLIDRSDCESAVDVSPEESKAFIADEKICKTPAAMETIQKDEEEDLLDDL